MYLRLLFVLLVMLNIVAAAWLLLGQPYGHVPPATDPGVPELRLLSELPSPAATPAVATTASVPAPTPAPAPALASAAKPADAVAKLRCLAIGPFATPHDLQQARSTLAPLATRTRTRQEQVSQSHGWWVYLPAPGSRAQALALARQLAASGLKDYLVVGGGDQPSTISLGLFKDQDNARKRRAEVTAAGFPARIVERTENTPQYWLDLVSTRGDLDWRSRIRADGVGSHSTSCF